RPIVIEDTAMNRIAECTDMPGLDEELSAEQVKDEIVSSTFEFKQAIRRLSNKTFDLISMPIIMNEEQLGFITTILYRKDDKLIVHLMERMVEMVALWMKQERVALETEEKLSGKFLNDLLYG